MKKWSLLLFWMLLFSEKPVFSDETPPDRTLRHLIEVKTDGAHHIGRPGSRGWELDYKRDRPGYAFTKMKEPLLLQPGLYRATFFLRRGHYPKKGLLFKSYGLFNIEIWDTTTNELVIQRNLQIIDFSAPDKYEPRWIEFSMEGREGHAIEPRVYWIGLANGEVEKITFERFKDPSLKELEEKAGEFSRQLISTHLENGFVVSRKQDGEPDETGDATTYTGFYVASLAWKYAVTRDEFTYQALENGIQTLHNSLKGTPEEPVLTRYVDPDGNPFPKNPSKDVYTAFFLAYSAAFPHIPNGPLKTQMKVDVERLGSKFLRDGLLIKNGDRVMVSLTPYLTEDEIRSGIEILFNDNRKLRKFVKNLKLSRRYLPFGELWPGMKKVIQALEKHDENALFNLVIPTMNGAFMLVERVRDILREQYRQDLFPKRFTNKQYPGIKLADILTTMLKRFPKGEDGDRIQRLSDLKILASNALISLHIVKTAEAITGQPHFSDYYRSNLHTQDELLKTALNWHNAEDELTQLTAGNPVADSERRGYLAMLSLINLFILEKNPTIKENYASLLKRDWNFYRYEDNPMVSAFVLVSSKEKEGNRDQILRTLTLYPKNRMGLGIDYWQENGKKIAEANGGGDRDGSSREALPVSVRPKDSFLWQRNPRRLKGDAVKTYPATDYLFVYWFCRAHNIIPPTPAQSIVER